MQSGQLDPLCPPTLEKHAIWVFVPQASPKGFFDPRLAKESLRECPTQKRGAWIVSDLIAVAPLDGRFLQAKRRLFALVALLALFAVALEPAEGSLTSVGRRGSQSDDRSNDAW